MYIALYVSAAVLAAFLVGLIIVRVVVANKRKGAFLPGNAATYDLKNVSPLGLTPLSGKNILFLGSSVTEGASSGGVSFVEYLAKRNSFTYKKEAVGGTTLADLNDSSYVSRLKKVRKEESFDLFICQLSTNDASKNIPLGKEGDLSTVLGAIDFIVDNVKDSWHCPVVFFTNPYYKNERYQEMVSALKKLALKKGFFIIDLFNNEVFNDISKQERALFMADAVHPTRAGYLKWWTPEMEEKLYNFIV